MYVARFSYDLLPVNRQRALDFINKEVAAAKQKGKEARLLVPLTRTLTFDHVREGGWLDPGTEPLGGYPSQ